MERLRELLRRALSILKRDRANCSCRNCLEAAALVDQIESELARGK